MLVLAAEMERSATEDPQQQPNDNLPLLRFERRAGEGEALTYFCDARSRSQLLKCHDKDLDGRLLSEFGLWRGDSARDRIIRGRVVYHNTCTLDQVTPHASTYTVYSARV